MNASRQQRNGALHGQTSADICQPDSDSYDPICAKLLALNNFGSGTPVALRGSVHHDRTLLRLDRTVGAGGLWTRKRRPILLIPAGLIVAIVLVVPSILRWTRT